MSIYKKICSYYIFVFAIDSC